MCGICGELNLDDRPARLTAVNRMLPTLARRGPDQQGSYQEGPMVFGHRRLAVIDLSHKAHQPMVDTELGLVLVFNGTIYNYKTLRLELEQNGYHFFSKGDTEVIIKAYHYWGERCVTRFDGMFAFAVWDKNKHSLFLARDRLGIKPLYYSDQNKTFRFASTPQALLAAGDVDTQIDQVGLHFQFSLHAVIPAPRTILRGIKKCPPAHTMLVNNGEVQVAKPYWSLAEIAIDEQKTEQQWQQEIRRCLQQAVAKRLHAADVSVGVLLSGGLDSSLLVALLAESDVDQVYSFSVGFEDTPQEKGSEFEFSDLVVERYGTEHRKFIIDNDEVLQALPDCVEAMAEPMFAQDAVAFYLLSQRVAQEIKVVQSGQGADEVFGGYFWYPQIEKAKGEAIDRFANHYFDRDHSEYTEMVCADFLGEDFTRKWAEDQLTNMQHGSVLDKVLRLDVTTLIVDDPVKRVDNMTMAWGLEARVPFLDHHLVELAASMPAQLKIQQGGKYPLKQIARALLPAEVIDRPKGYFPMPALKYVRGPFLEFMREVLQSKACKQRGLFNFNYVNKLLQQPEQHLTRIKGNKLWHLALLEFWLQKHVDPAT